MFSAAKKVGEAKRLPLGPLLPGRRHRFSIGGVEEDHDIQQRYCRGLVASEKVLVW